ncbi:MULTISPECIES: ABC transporter permease [Rothia]|uniref:ABC transporter permease n=1 Tax=Rothia TaxID=32207 RepID=UPI000834F365|nr:ABC transporter permease [Rothia sp. ND6WE1A]
MKLSRFIALDIKQAILNFSTLFGIIVMPAGMYLLFGAAQSYGTQPFHDGNVSAYVMLGMAVYGAVTGALSASGTAVLEIESGWGRQLALTPIRWKHILLSKCVIALITTMLPVIIVNIFGSMTGAEIPIEQQIICAAVTVVCCTIFSFYGMALAQVFKNARAVSIGSGLLVFFSFFGTTFSPLPESMMSIARFTPLYGVTELSRFAFTHGDTLITGQNPWFVNEPLAYALINTLVWGGIFVAICLKTRKRANAR